AENVNSSDRIITPRSGAGAGFLGVVLGLELQAKRTILRNRCGLHLTRREVRLLFLCLLAGTPFQNEGKTCTHSTAQADKSHSVNVVGADSMGIVGNACPTL